MSPITFIRGQKITKFGLDFQLQSPLMGSGFDTDQHAIGDLNIHLKR